MGQHHSLLAFRKRAKNRGYREIKIEKAGTVEGKELYRCTALEPLSGQKITTVRSIEYFNAILR